MNLTPGMGVQDWISMGKMLDRNVLLNKADEEGWDSQKMLQEAAKRGVVKDPNVLGRIKQKRQQEQQAFQTEKQKMQLGVTPEVSPTQKTGESYAPSEKIYDLSKAGEVPKQEQPDQEQKEAKAKTLMGTREEGTESKTTEPELSTLDYGLGGEVSESFKKDIERVTGDGARQETEGVQSEPKANVAGVEIDPYQVSQEDVASIVKQNPNIINERQAINLIQTARKNANYQYAGLLEGADMDELGKAFSKMPAQARSSAAVQDAFGEKVNQEVAREIIRVGGGTDYAYKTRVIDKALNNIERQTGQTFDLTKENYKEIEHLVDLYKDPMEKAKIEAENYAKTLGLQKDTISELIKLMNSKLDMKKFKHGKVQDYLKMARDFYEGGTAKTGDFMGSSQEEIPEMLELGDAVMNKVLPSLKGSIDDQDYNVLYGQMEGLANKLAEMNKMGSAYTRGQRAGEMGSNTNSKKSDEGYSQNSSKEEIAKTLENK